MARLLTLLSVFGALGASATPVDNIFGASIALTLPFQSTATSTASTNPYAPVTTACPAQTLVRSAAELNPQEAEYIQKRNAKAAEALDAWLSKHGDFCNTDQPTIAFASSGGGLRAFLEAAGIVQAFDGRDGNAGTNGLYQAFSYQSGISGATSPVLFSCAH